MARPKKANLQKLALQLTDADLAILERVVALKEKRDEIDREIAGLIGGKAVGKKRGRKPGRPLKATTPKVQRGRPAKAKTPPKKAKRGRPPKVKTAAKSKGKTTRTPEQQAAINARMAKARAAKAGKRK